MLHNFIKTTIRNLLRQKLYSSITLAGLSIGMGCVLIIYTYIKNELDRGVYHQHADEIYRVDFRTHDGMFRNSYQPGKLSAHLKENYPEIVQASNYLTWQSKLSAGEEGVIRMGAYVDADFLTMFTPPLLHGDLNTALNEPGSIIISEKLATALFRRTDVLGENIRFADARDLKVTGIIETAKNYPEFDNDFLIPTSIAPGWADQWGSKCCFSYVRLSAASDWRETSEKIAGVMDAINPQWQNTLFLQPFKNNFLHAQRGWSPITYYVCFALMALFVLLIGCVNFINLSFARMQTRGKEIGIRKVVGSSRTQISLQFLGEAFVYTFISLLLAIMLVECLLPLINQSLSLDLNLAYTLGSMSAMLVLTIITGLIAGAYPAFQIANYNPVSIFRPYQSAWGRIFRKSLIVFQFTLAVFLLICLFLIGDQVTYMNKKDLGFEKENLLMIKISGDLTVQRNAAKQAIAALPSVKNVSVSANNLQFWGNSGPLDWSGKSPDALIEFGYNWVDDDFVQTLGTEAVKGRFFSQEYSTDVSNGFVINEAAYQLLQNNGLSEPLGANVKAWFGTEGTIIGVLKDFHTASLHQAMMPAVFLHSVNAQLFGSFLMVRLNPGNPTQALSEIRQAIKTVVPNDPCEIEFFDESIQSAYENEQTTYKLTASGAILALIVSCLGLFGLTALTVEQRKKEIGVRKVVGASTESIFLLFTSDFLRWICLANLIAWPVAWVTINRWLQEFSYRIEIGVTAFLYATFLTLAAALIAIAYQTFKTAESNPIESLRYE